MFVALGKEFDMIHPLHLAEKSFFLSEKRKNRKGNTVYMLQTDIGKIHFYCHMSSSRIGGCGGREWTLVMKIDSRKRAFHYDSSSWTNMADFNHRPNSLYSLIADGHYRSPSQGQNTWKSLIGSHASLRTNCNKGCLTLCWQPWWLPA
ncbi:hypothetical protein pdam_00007816 [Pocillopora damicornis]|uniref:Fibrinogen C-terminal domain-containing protein n=1 Tax=Pocillopora damicornis TaxID=46731 RepID=A0A3M6TXQ8_POCDA|nr:hypothetical protein pdam_00007816 [Pocillopora damicornis]